MRFRTHHKTYFLSLRAPAGGAAIPEIAEPVPSAARDLAPRNDGFGAGPSVRANLRLSVLLATAVVVMLAAAGTPLRANAAVPVAVTYFAANTNYEVSLETFLGSFMTSFFSTYLGALQQRQEDFEKTFLIGQIEAAREDVNKLVFDTLRELKEGALGGVVVGNPNEAQSVVKGLGFRTPPEIAESSHQCASGAYVAGSCLVVKREGRVVTNVDYYLYEEPLEKARQFVNCYYNLAEWRQAANGMATYSFLSSPNPNDPSNAHVRDSIIQLDLQKISVLSQLQRTERGLQNSAPVTWYRSDDVSTIDWDHIKELAQYQKLIDINKCEIVLRNTSCTQANGCFNASRLSDLLPTGSESGSALADNLAFTRSAYLQAGYDPDFLSSESQELTQPDVPTSKINVATSPNWSWELVDKSRNPVNTLEGLRERVTGLVERIVTETHESRNAQFVAGQGIRPETYLIGWPNRFAKGNLKDKYYFVDTENIISPSFILLAKVRAAIQAQFDLAQKAYKYPPEENAKETKYPFTGVERDSEGKYVFQKYDLPSLAPTISKLPAPFEDFGKYLNLPSSLVDNPSTYALNGPPNTTTKSPNTNYLNRFFKDVLQLHERSFGDVLATWFTDEADFFRPRPSVVGFFRNPAEATAAAAALEARITELNAAIASLEGSAVENKETLLAAAREARSRLTESASALRAGNTASAQTIYGNLLEAELKLGLVEGSLSGEHAANFGRVRGGIGAGSATRTQLENAALREQIASSLAAANQARTLLGTVPGGAAAGADVGRAIAVLQGADRLIQLGGAANAGTIRTEVQRGVGILQGATNTLNLAGTPTAGAYEVIGRLQTGINAAQRIESVITNTERVASLIASGDPLSVLTGVTAGLQIFKSLPTFFTEFGLGAGLGLLGL